MVAHASLLHTLDWEIYYIRRRHAGWVNKLRRLQPSGTLWQIYDLMAVVVANTAGNVCCGRQQIIGHIMLTKLLPDDEVAVVRGRQSSAICDVDWEKICSFLAVFYITAGYSFEVDTFYQQTCLCRQNNKICADLPLKFSPCTRTVASLSKCAMQFLPIAMTHISYCVCV